MASVVTNKNNTIITIDKQENIVNELFNVLWFEFLDSKTNEYRDYSFEKHHKDFLTFIEQKFDEMD